LSPDWYGSPVSVRLVMMQVNVPLFLFFRDAKVT
jgi:hypothetical protein